MLILNRLLPYLTAILIFAGFEILFREPKWIYFVVPIFIIWIFFTIWKLFGVRSASKLAQWNFLINPVIFILGSGLFFVFIEKAIFKHLLFFFTAILSGLFIETLFIYIYDHENYKSGALENISRLMNLIAFYFYLSGVYGLSIFLSLPFWLLIILALPVLAVLSYETFWINKIETKKGRPYIIIISLVLGELLITVSFLPTSFYVNGFILTIFYYVMTGLSLDYFYDRIKKWTISKYLIIGILMLLLVLITAQWT